MWFEDMQNILFIQNETGGTNGMTLKLFDSETIDIINYIKLTDEEWGFVKSGWVIVQKDFVCDVQDATQERLERTWGHDIKASKIVYCRPNNLISESSLLRFNNIIYKIKKIKYCKNTKEFTGDRFLKIALLEHDQQNLEITGDIS